MGHCHVRLDPASKQLCAVVLPFGKCEHQAIPMGLSNSPDILQEKMSELMDGLAFVRTCIDDLLCLTKGAFSDNLEKVELVPQRLQCRKQDLRSTLRNHSSRILNWNAQGAGLPAQELSLSMTR